VSGKESEVRFVEVPPASLEPATLTRIIEEFVLREGTDYGPGEYSLEEKVSEVRRQIEKGKARILYDSQSESCTIDMKIGRRVR